MSQPKKKNYKKLIWLVSAAIALLFVSAGVFVVKVLVSDDGQKRIRQIQRVTLVKPPPPPKIKEEPPPPEVKKEEIVEPEPEETPPEDISDTDDAPPPGPDLGLDADGTGAGDSFGLVGKKGGRALIGGGGGDLSLLRKYAWYTQILQDEIRRKVRRYLEQNGGIPKGDLKTLVRISLDEVGNVIDYTIYGSSGHHAMDEAVEEALRMAKVSEPPPSGMPKTMRLKISSKG